MTSCTPLTSFTLSSGEFRWVWGGISWYHWFSDQWLTLSSVFTQQLHSSHLRHVNIFICSDSNGQRGGGHTGSPRCRPCFTSTSGHRGPCRYLHLQQSTTGGVWGEFNPSCSSGFNLKKMKLTCEWHCVSLLSCCVRWFSISKDKVKVIKRVTAQTMVNHQGKCSKMSFGSNLVFLPWTVTRSLQRWSGFTEPWSTVSYFDQEGSDLSSILLHIICLFPFMLQSVLKPITALNQQFALGTCLVFLFPVLRSVVTFKDLLFNGVNYIWLTRASQSASVDFHPPQLLSPDGYSKDPFFCLCTCFRNQI